MRALQEVRAGAAGLLFVYKPRLLLRENRDNRPVPVRCWSLSDKCRGRYLSLRESREIQSNPTELPDGFLFQKEWKVSESCISDFPYLYPEDTRELFGAQTLEEASDGRNTDH